MFQKCSRIVANLTQNTEFLFRFCFVSFGRTRLYEAFACGVASVAGYGEIYILQRVLLPVHVNERNGALGNAFESLVNCRKLFRIKCRTFHALV
jgi:hypothetical protein